MEILRIVMIALSTIMAAINCWEFNNARLPYYGIKMLMWLILTQIWLTI